MNPQIVRYGNPEPDDEVAEWMQSQNPKHPIRELIHSMIRQETCQTKDIPGNPLSLSVG
jgi:hypothetical protein